MSRKIATYGSLVVSTLYENFASKCENFIENVPENFVDLCDTMDDICSKPAKINATKLIPYLVTLNFHEFPISDTCKMDCS